MRAMRAADISPSTRSISRGRCYMTAEEAAGVDVRAGTHPRRAG